MASGPYHMEKKIPLRMYITQKILMLTDEFYIDLSYEEEIHMRSLKTEADVDQYAHDILMLKL